MSTSPYHLGKPGIVWRDGVPVSPAFDDVYYSRADGREETRYVFLSGNCLPDRWKNCQTFTIAETGFGTGLNFMETWCQWESHAPSHARLTYISAEQNPLSAKELEQALFGWQFPPEKLQALLNALPPAVPGIHTLRLDTVTLMLLYGDAATLLSQLQAQVDAWFLDGFAPAKNPELWSEDLFATIAKHTAPSGTFATYTAASAVRKGLDAVGFAVQKQQGFGHKRDMLVGEYSAKPVMRPSVKLWYAAPSCNHVQNAIVIGAGLAGSAAAYSLAQRGWQVSVIEKHGAPAQEASGNPAGILYPLLATEWTPAMRFYMAGLMATQARIAALQRAGHAIPYEPCGMLQFGKSDEDATRLVKAAETLGLPDDVMRAVDNSEASQISGIPLDHSAVWFALSGWTSAQSICAAQLEMPSITTRYNTTITSIEYHDGTWSASANGEVIAEAPVLILANAADATTLLPEHYFPLRTIHGQVSYLPGSDALAPLKTILCHKAYLTPAHGDGYHSMGATYDHGVTQAEVKDVRHQENRERFCKRLPELEAALPAPKKGWASFRTVSKDRLPLVGPVANQVQLETHFSKLHQGTPGRVQPETLFLPGLYCSLAHASRGLLSTVLSGEYLAAMIAGEAMPVETDITEALHPARFYMREFRKAPEKREFSA